MLFEVKNRNARSSAHFASQPNYDRPQVGKLLYQLRDSCKGNRGTWTAILRDELFHGRTGFRVLADRLIDAYLATLPPDEATPTPDAASPNPNGSHSPDVIAFSNGNRIDRATGELLLAEGTPAPPPRSVVLPDVVQEYKNDLDYCLNAPKNSIERGRRIRAIFCKWKARLESGESPRRVKGYIRFPRNLRRLYEHLDAVRQYGAAGLLDERGKGNAGVRSVPPEEVERWQGFVLTHLDTPNVGNKRARQARRKVVNLRGLLRVYQRQYPDSPLTEWQARDIYKHIPPAWFKTPRQWRTEHARGNVWLNPYANHTWSFDMTDSSRYFRRVNERGEIEIFKPEIGVMVDEFSGIFCALIGLTARAARDCAARNDAATVGVSGPGDAPTGAAPRHRRYGVGQDHGGARIRTRPPRPRVLRPCAGGSGEVPERLGGAGQATGVGPPQGVAPESGQIQTQRRARLVEGRRRTLCARAIHGIRISAGAASLVQPASLTINPSPRPSVR